jgi:hypothetical protein
MDQRQKDKPWQEGILNKVKSPAQNINFQKPKRLDVLLLLLLPHGAAIKMVLIIEKNQK